MPFGISGVVRVEAYVPTIDYTVLVIQPFIRKEQFLAVKTIMLTLPFIRLYETSGCKRKLASQIYNFAVAIATALFLEE